MSGLIEDPTFWVAVAFVIFVAAAFKKVRDGLNSALDGRAARIKAQLDEARQLREEAQAALAEYQRKVRDAAAEAKAIVDHARVEAERLRERARADQEHALKRREQLAIEKIAQAEAEALEQVRNQAVDLAVAATARLLAENMDENQAGRLINEAIQELPDKLH
jgi:F-type H+-transporting ATPase subunit b